MSAKQTQAQARDLKHRVLTCLHKLSDRDTHAASASELESIARTLSSDALPSFISSISATDSSDKSPVRRQCIRLVAVLSEYHGNSLAPHLSKVLSAVVRRLRDPDSSVRSACVAASLSLSSQLTTPPFASISKPFIESLFMEQDANTQNGAALCLAAVVEGSRNPDAGSLRKLMPRLEKLAKCESFKAKAAILALIGSVVGVKGVLSGGGKINRNVMKNLIACLMEFLSSEEWAARKAAAEGLMKIAVTEKDGLSEFKASCLKTFEAKRYDKVKAARETMNQMLEAWKEIPDLPTPESILSKEEFGSDGRYSKKESRGVPVDEQGRGRRSSSSSSSSPAAAIAMFRKKGVDNQIDINNINSKLDKPLEMEMMMMMRENDMMIISEDLSLIRSQLVHIQNQQSTLLHILQRFIGSSENGIHSQLQPPLHKHNYS
ncbi:ARM repeat superfamily protein [Perilla frutescens var. hirtella]|uniref:ARM repeat superfamily protein n=1 Tax=Perilla frutescens var. hirtella TaxID=608512 RepID=A0AAD4IQ30_PERFH|nr:ARM repeat superfamily protein [Perilla frutescens var. hirtella]